MGRPSHIAVGTEVGGGLLNQAGEHCDLKRPGNDAGSK
jgi:hypothetical protein